MATGISKASIASGRKSPVSFKVEQKETEEKTQDLQPSILSSKESSPEGKAKVQRSIGRYFLPSESKIDQVALKKFKEEKIKQGTEELQKRNISLKDEQAVTKFFVEEFGPLLDKEINLIFREDNPHILANRGGIKVGIYHRIKHPKV